MEFVSNVREKVEKIGCERKAYIINVRPTYANGSDDQG
jgi:hypothetical protein